MLIPPLYTSFIAAAITATHPQYSRFPINFLRRVLLTSLEPHTIAQVFSQAVATHQKTVKAASLF